MNTIAPAGAGPRLPEGRRRLVAVLLGMSLACNLAVLVAPFMELRVGLGQTDYTLMRTVLMLRERGLWVLAVLVFLALQRYFVRGLLAGGLKG